MNKQDKSHSFPLRSRPQILPLLIFLGAGLFVLKLSSVWVGFSSVEASTFFSKKPGIVFDRDRDRQNQQTENSAVQTQSEIEPVIIFEDAGSQTRILERLGARHKALDEREAAIDVREELLAAAEIRLEEKFAQFSAEKAALEELEQRRDAAKTEELQALVSAYERMKPREAARIFEILEDDLLVSVAAEMRTQALSGVLSQMAPERARALTQLMADRNETQSAPQQSRETDTDE